MHQVKIIRKKCGMKLIDLAATLGIQSSNYSNMENGKLLPLNIDEVEEQALKILTPKLKELIDKKKTELNELIKMYEDIIGH